MKSLARERDQAEIRARLKRLRPDSERHFGSMSAQQMVCHLADNFRMALGQKAATAPSGPLQRTLIKWLALYAPLRWPPGNSTSRVKNSAQPPEVLPLPHPPQNPRYFAASL